MTSQVPPVPSKQQEPPAIEQHVMEGFTEAVTSLAINVHQFGENFAKTEENRRQRQEEIEQSRVRDRRTWIAGILVTLILVTIGVILLARVSSIADENQQNGAVTRDCVQPGGECFNRQKADLEEAVRRANDGNNNGRVDTEEILDSLKRIESQPR